MIVQRDACANIEDRGGLASLEVRGHHLLIGPVQDALHLTSGILLDRRHDILVLGRLLKADRQVHDRNVRRRDAEGHARELAVHRWQHLAHSLGGTSRRGDDVLRGATATAPVLAATGRAVHCELRGRHGMHRGHQALDDAEPLVHDLRQGRQAVRGAAGVGDHGVRGLVLLVVHTHDVDGHIVLRGRGDDHLLGTALQMQLGPPPFREDTRGLADVVRSGSAPRDVRRVLLVEDLDLHAIHDQELIAIGLLRRDGSTEPPVHAVVLHHVHHVLEVHEGVVHRLHRRLGVAHSGAEDQTADAAKAVDAQTRRHDEVECGCGCAENKIGSWRTELESK
mmetsp:Transcript_26439/g.66932  ORF Transcript_26439/g.66932 Transcript_26439/m.66932 type:complete len:337 (+) Transcript_26439:417-1427(+)